MMLFAFHIAQILLEKKCNDSPFSDGQTVVQTGLFILGMATDLGEGKL